MTSPAVPFNDLEAMTREVRPAVDDAWADLLASGRFVSGEAVDRFETEWAAYCGTDYAVGVANGTDALELALRAVGVRPGDEVVLPANTFIATALAVARVGADPVLVDVDEATMLIDVEEAKAAVTGEEKAPSPDK